MKRNFPFSVKINKFIKALLFYTISTLICFKSFSQEKIKNYIQTNFTVISKDSNEYSSFRSIGDAVKDYNVVMLGEQDHGDAATFNVKTKLIQYLHEYKGFNILAFESDFFGINFGLHNITGKKASLDSFIKANIYPLWTYCDACQELFYNYIPNTYTTSTPLILAGFDNQMGSKYLFLQLDSVIKLSKIPITKLPDYSTTIFPLIKNWISNINDTSQIAKINFYLYQIKKELSEKNNVDKFWLLVIDNLVSQNLEFMNYKNNNTLAQNIRDSQMAINLLWLVKTKYQNQKIIVWAHNYHISKYGGHFEENFLNNKTMGTVFTSKIDSAIKPYIIGFTSYQGTTARIGGKKYTLEKPQKNSFENWVASDADFGFIDFLKYNSLKNSDEPFYLSGAIKGNQYHKSHSALWNKIFDGVFFIRNMYPCVQVK